MDFDDEDDEDMLVNHHPPIEQFRDTVASNDVNQTTSSKSQSQSTSTNSNQTKTMNYKIPVREHYNKNEQSNDVEQQEEWEDFENSKSNYKQSRLRLGRKNLDQDGGTVEHDDYDDDDGDGRLRSVHHDNITGDDHQYDLDGNDEQSGRLNRHREIVNEKPVWKLDQIKTSETVSVNTLEDKLDEPVVNVAMSKPVAPVSSMAYRPPQMRSGTSVTIVSGVSQRPKKKEKPNLASTEEFPTLGAATTNKK
jgi:hypothetical protein